MIPTADIHNVLERHLCCVQEALSLNASRRDRASEDLLSLGHERARLESLRVQIVNELRQLRISQEGKA